MARISLGLCLMLVVASSVIYEAQGHFLLKKYLTTQFPSKGNEFTPYVNKGLTEFLGDLERFCPPTPEFKGFFTEFRSYMSFIQTSSSSSSKNIEHEMTKKADGLFKAMSAISGGAGQKSAEAGSFKSTMLSMGKTLVEQQKSTTEITATEKKTLVTSMVKWTKTIASVVKTASEKKGKKIDTNSFGLDVDVNDKAIMTVSGSSQRSHASTKSSSESSSESSTYAARAETGSSAKAKETAGGRAEKGEKNDEKKEKKGEKKEEKSDDKKEKNEKSSARAQTKEASSTSAGASGSTRTENAFKDTTGGSAGSPRGSPTAGKGRPSGKGSPRGSPTSGQGRTTEKGSGNAASSMKQQSNAGSASSMNQQSSSASSSSSETTSVTEIEKETSQETNSFISGLEKRYSQKAELKPFFEKLKASMTASSRVSSTKSVQEYASTAKTTTGKLSDAMTFVGSRFSNSAEMKSNIETKQENLMKSLQEFQDLNKKIVGEEKVSSSKETQIKQTMSRIEQVTTQFVETAASSSSTSSTSSQQSQQQNTASSQQQKIASSQQQKVASSQEQKTASTQEQNQQQNGMGRLKNN